MSETEIKITNSFLATDEKGGEYQVVEYTVFDETETAETSIDAEESVDDKPKLYKLVDDEKIKQLSDSNFAIESKGTIIHRKDNQ